MSEGISGIESSVQISSTQFEDYVINVVVFPEIEVNITGGEYLQTFQKYIIEAFESCSDGFSALIFVLNYSNQFTNQETEMLKFLRTALGSEVVKENVIYLFTHDSDKNKWKMEGHIQDLLKESDRRWVLFNKTSNDQSTRANVIERLIYLAKQTKAYTIDDYIAATEAGEENNYDNLSKLVLDHIQKHIQRLEFERKDSETINDLSEREEKQKNILKETEELEEKILNMKHEFKENENLKQLIFDLKSKIESKVKFFTKGDKTRATFQVTVKSKIKPQNDQNPKEKEIVESDSIITGINHKKREKRQEKNVLNFLLIGVCGNGKSSSGNSILGEKVFKTSSGSASLESSVQKYSTQFENYTINVVDIPGIEFDVKLDESLEKFQNILGKGFEHSDEGFSALIFVLNYSNRFTKQEIEMLNFLRTTLGSDVIKNNVICLFTHGDMFESDMDELKLDFDSWCKQQEGQIKDLLQECDHRCVLFNNKSPKVSVRTNQIKRLISFTKQTKKYTTRDYRASSEEREKQKSENLSAKILGDTQKFLNQLRSKMSKSERITDTSKRIEQLESILNELKKHEEEIVSMNIEFKRSHNPKNLIFALKSEIESKIKLLEQTKHEFKRGQAMRATAPHRRRGQVSGRNVDEQIGEEDTPGKFKRGEHKRVSLPARGSRKTHKEKPTKQKSSSKSLKNNCVIL